jgi:hypothetical protein
MKIICTYWSCIYIVEWLSSLTELRRTTHLIRKINWWLHWGKSLKQFPKIIFKQHSLTSMLAFIAYFQTSMAIIMYNISVWCLWWVTYDCHEPLSPNLPQSYINVLPPTGISFIKGITKLVLLVVLDVSTTDLRLEPQAYTSQGQPLKVIWWDVVGDLDIWNTLKQKLLHHG